MTDWDKEPSKDSLRDSIHDSIRDSIRDSIHDSIPRDIHGKVPAARSCSSGGYHGIIWGGAICAVGVILLLDHMGIVSADHLWRFWPMLLIVAGATSLTQPGKRAWGTLLLVSGMLFQLDALGVLRFRWADLWPLVIITVGAVMIWNSIETRRVRDTFGFVGDASPGMNAVAIFGGVERRVGGSAFRRGTISAIFGGAEIDFREADIDGPEAFLEINTCCGGAEIRVPETWRVDYRGQSVFGGYSDKTRVVVSGNPNATPTKTLVITGTNLFGGVEVKN
jgi:hypothetical protein